MTKIFPRIALALVVVSSLDVGTYLVLSLRGRYEPGLWGLGVVKCYQWAPAGFVEGYQWDRRLMIGFLPLWKLDQWLWHEELWGDDESEYPVNKVEFNK